MEKSHEAFVKFMDLVRSVTNCDRDITRLIQKRYSKAQHEYLASPDFVSLINDTTQKINDHSSKKYVHIRALVGEMKAYEVKKESRLSGLKRDLDQDGSSAVSDSDHNLPDSHPAKRQKFSDKRLTKVLDADLDYASQDSSSSKTTECFMLDAVPERDATKTEAGRDIKPVVEKLEQDPLSYGDSITNSKSGVDTDVYSTGSVKTDTVNKTSSSPTPQPQPSSPAAPLPSTSGHHSKPKSHKKSSSKRGKSPSHSPSRSPSHHQAMEEGADALHAPGNKKLIRARGAERQVTRLEKFLQDLYNQITHLEAREVSLDDLDDENCSYALLSRYKEKFIKAWNKLCEVKGCTPSVGRSTEKKFRFEGTRYPEVNKKIERFVNKFRCFPDYQDIHELVCACNRQHHLKLGRRMLEQLARDAFTDVGNKLQERRMKDYVENFGSHLTDRYRSTRDPALFDRDLHHKLEHNRQQGRNKLDEVIRKFSYKQEQHDFNETSDDEDEEEQKEAASDTAEDDVAKATTNNSEDAGDVDDDDAGRPGTDCQENGDGDVGITNEVATVHSGIHGETQAGMDADGDDVVMSVVDHLTKLAQRVHENDDPHSATDSPLVHFSSGNQPDSGSYLMRDATQGDAVVEDTHFYKHATPYTDDAYNEASFPLQLDNVPSLPDVELKLVEIGDVSVVRSSEVEEVTPSGEQVQSRSVSPRKDKKVQHKVKQKQREEIRNMRDEVEYNNLDILLERINSSSKDEESGDRMDVSCVEIKVQEVKLPSVGEKKKVRRVRTTFLDKVTSPQEGPSEGKVAKDEHVLNSEQKVKPLRDTEMPPQDSLQEGQEVQSEETMKVEEAKSLTHEGSEVLQETASREDTSVEVGTDITSMKDDNQPPDDTEGDGDGLRSISGDAVGEGNVEGAPVTPSNEAVEETLKSAAAAAAADDDDEGASRAASPGTPGTPGTPGADEGDKVTDETPEASVDENIDIDSSTEAAVGSPAALPETDNSEKHQEASPVGKISPSIEKNLDNVKETCPDDVLEHKTKDHAEESDPNKGKEKMEDNTHESNLRDTDEEKVLGSSSSTKDVAKETVKNDDKKSQPNTSTPKNSSSEDRPKPRRHKSSSDDVKVISVERGSNAKPRRNSSSSESDIEITSVTVCSKKPTLTIRKRGDRISKTTPLRKRVVTANSGTITRAEQAPTLTRRESVANAAAPAVHYRAQSTLTRANLCVDNQRQDRGVLAPTLTCNSRSTMTRGNNNMLGRSTLTRANIPPLRPRLPQPRLGPYTRPMLSLQNTMRQNAPQRQFLSHNSQFSNRQPLLTSSPKPTLKIQSYRSLSKNIVVQEISPIRNPNSGSQRRPIVQNSDPVEVIDLSD